MMQQGDASCEHSDFSSHFFRTDNPLPLSAHPMKVPLRSGGASTRLWSRRGSPSAPTPLETGGSDIPQPLDYAGFLKAMLPQQDKLIDRHRLQDERVWLKKAGPRHGMARYRLLGLAAGLFRLDVLRPVPNPGGEAAIAIEARRLRQLAQAGLRVPVVLAEQADGLLISDLGESGVGAQMMQERLEQAAAAGPATLLAAWREGLDAIARVHEAGCYLSQAFARNLVQCPDGVIGYIDFEDDPGETLSLDECQARDWLSYLHSTGALVHASAPHAAGAHWHAVLADAREDVRARLALAARRMRWLRRLPKGRRWGRDTQRVRAAARLRARWYGPEGLRSEPTRY
jgi:tRNA A-37 threonylcarbamoyl transferase component Bud32